MKSIRVKPKDSSSKPYIHVNKEVIKERDIDSGKNVGEEERKDISNIVKDMLPDNIERIISQEMSHRKGLRGAWDRLKEALLKPYNRPAKEFEQHRLSKRRKELQELLEIYAQDIKDPNSSIDSFNTLEPSKAEDATISNMGQDKNTDDNANNANDEPFNYII